MQFQLPPPVTTETFSLKGEAVDAGGTNPWSSPGSGLPAPPSPPDEDGDGIVDAVDNCVSYSNASQTDSDGDGRGDGCDRCVGHATIDWDKDGVCVDLDCHDMMDAVGLPVCGVCSSDCIFADGVESSDAAAWWVEES
jgi:hypothetical protein